MTGPQIITFGCRLNSLESEVMRGHAASAGLDDVVVVHTCAVTAEAERQARQAIRRAKRERPDARVVVTGCSAQISPDTYADMPEVARVLGNTEKLDLGRWQELARGDAEPARVVVSDIMALRETAHHLVDGLDGRTRAFVQVQNGCDHRCTFCIIPYGRGNSRSVPAGEVVEQARRLVRAGYKSWCSRASI
jgi:threonylcarbamoyladenosine tRNA methylthiotransferase MtaB